MRKTNLLLISVLVVMGLLCGCHKEVQEKTIYVIGKNVDFDANSDKDSAKPAEMDIKNLKIIFVNRLGVDVGMISLIDPVTEEQVNVDALADGEMITVGSNIPREITELDWAIYNSKGELYSESTTDISQANESVWIILEGNSAVENIQVLLDKTEDEVAAQILQ